MGRVARERRALQRERLSEAVLFLLHDAPHDGCNLAQIIDCFALAPLRASALHLRPGRRPLLDCIYMV